VLSVRGLCWGWESEVTLTVRDVLALDIMREAGAHVLAGAALLDRQVRWVHVSELPDIAHLLQGGELLLTTGLALRDDPDLQRRFIGELADVGVAGIVIELGRTFPSLPPRLVDEAESRRVPLIVLQREVRYVEVTEIVHSAIINRQYQSLQKANTIRQDFASLVLRGASAQRIVHRLAEIVGNPIVVEDRAHQVVEFDTYGDTVDGLLTAWESHSRKGHAWHGKMAVSIWEGCPRCAWVPVVVRDEAWGCVHDVDSV